VDAGSQLAEQRLAVAGHRQGPAPRVLERYVGEAREAPLEGTPVGAAGPFPLASVDPGAATVRVDVADEDAPIGQAPHGRAGRVGRDHPPGAVPADRRRFLVGERSGHRPPGDDRDEAPPGDAEALGEAVVGQHQFGRADRTGVRAQQVGWADVEVDHRRLLVEGDVGREVVGQPSHEGRRLHLHGAGRVDRTRVEVDAEAVDRRRLVEHLVGLVDVVEGGGEVVEVPCAPIGAGGVRLAGPRPAAVDVVVDHGRLEVRLAGPVQGDLAALVLGGVTEPLGPQVVGVVDGESRRAAGGAVADEVRLEQQDRGVGTEFAETPGRSQAGESGPHDHHVGADVTRQRCGGQPGREGLEPAVVAVVAGEEGDGGHTPRTGPSRSS
jgi:hypothetical protein